ncbi:MAG: bifunctional aldolase/short-chain dehydrogenase, partial [Acidimicrobiales bacterium]
MLDRWDDASARDACGTGPGAELRACVYGSRLLGAEPLLVLHGGGNTSTKVPGADLLGEPIDILWVKGSGYDLASITCDGFA